MSIFGYCINSYKKSFDINYIKKVKAQQLELLKQINKKQDLINTIINKLTVIDQQYSEIIQQNNAIIQLINEKSKNQRHLIELLNNKDSNFQNLYAKQRGYKSGFYYKTALNAEINKNKSEINKHENKITEYERELEENQQERIRKQKELETTKIELNVLNEKLKVCEDALHFYKYARFLLILSNLSAALNCLCYIFVNVHNISFLTKILMSSLAVSANFVIYILLYVNEKKMRLLLSQDKTSYFNFCYSLVCCLCIYFTLFNNIVFNWISTALLFVATGFVLYNTYTIVKFAEKENDFNLAIDYMMFNSAIINFIILYMMFLFKMPNSINYCSFSMLALIFVLYALGFFWLLKRKNRNQKATFKHCLGLFLNVIFMIILFFLLFINIYKQIPISQGVSFWAPLILSILVTFITPILSNIFKYNISNPIDSKNESEHKKEK